MEKIGILGGTFNPIHNGHLILAQNAFEEFSLDHILFIPSGRSYMKEDVLPSKERYEMVRLAIADNPAFQISDMEIVRKGNSYTYETLRILKEQNPDQQYEYIIGADTLFSIENWQKPEQIFQMAGILCAVREGYDMDKMQRKREELAKRYHARIRFLKERSFDISSSEIRERIHERKTAAYFLPEKVLDYIKANRLYQ